MYSSKAPAGLLKPLAARRKTSPLRILRKLMTPLVVIVVVVVNIGINAAGAVVVVEGQKGDSKEKEKRKVSYR